MFGLAIHGGAGTLPRARNERDLERFIARGWPKR
jgi:hypothetical protein